MNGNVTSGCHPLASSSRQPHTAYATSRDKGSRVLTTVTMEGGEDSGSFLEPQSSIASTVSIGRDIDSREGGDRDPRTFDVDTESSSSEDCRHDQRADLQRMMSRRNFAVVDSTGLRHRVRSSSVLVESLRPEAHNTGGHGRRRSSITVAPEANEAPPGQDQRQSNQVRERERE